MDTSPAPFATETPFDTEAPSVAAAKHARCLQIGAEALPTRVPWRLVVLFIAVAVVGAWAICLPFWFAGGLEAVSPVAFQLLLLAMMFTPTVAAIIVVFVVQRPKRPASLLGLRIRPVGRTLLITAIAWIAPPVLLALGVLLAGALGFVTVDLTLEGFQTTYLSNMAALGIDEATIAETALLPAWLLAVITLVPVLTINVVVGSFSAFGEELGWRGWLLPSLRPLGTWPAILISCVVWGLWHAPIILLGYNFMDRGIVGVLLMVGFCVSIGIFFSWLRLRSATVYPAAIAHGSLNATVTTVAMVLIGDIATVDTKVAVIGWTAWVPFVLVGVLLVLIGQMRKQPLPGLTLAESAVAGNGATERPVGFEPGVEREALAGSHRPDARADETSPLP